MNMITARGIKRCFTVGNGEPFYALKGIDLDIPEGKLAILKGRSGSGKTTLIRIIMNELSSEYNVSLFSSDVEELLDLKKDTLHFNNIIPIHDLNVRNKNTLT